MDALFDLDELLSEFLFLRRLYEISLDHVTPERLVKCSHLASY
jgi:hypothetical protein